MKFRRDRFEEDLEPRGWRVALERSYSVYTSSSFLIRPDCYTFVDKKEERNDESISKNAGRISVRVCG